jgi:hypothetical protein
MVSTLSVPASHRPDVDADRVRHGIDVSPPQRIVSTGHNARKLQERLSNGVIDFLEYPGGKSI